MTEQMFLLHDYESWEPYWVTKKEYDAYMEMRESFLCGIQNKLTESKGNSGIIIFGTNFICEDDRIKEMWNTYKVAKDNLSSMLGVSKSREGGLVKYFQPSYSMDIDGYGAELIKKSIGPSAYAKFMAEVKDFIKDQKQESNDKSGEEISSEQKD